jgi:hypothetical protein
MVTMARGRFISNAVIEDSEIHELSSDTCRLAYVFLITLADREGRITGEPGYLTSKLFPRRREITTEIVKGFIQEWADAGFVVWYEDNNGKQALQLINFEKHQRGLRKERETESEFGKPDNSRILAGYLPVEKQDNNDVKELKDNKESLINNSNINLNVSRAINDGTNPELIRQNVGKEDKKQRHASKNRNEPKKITDNSQIVFKLRDKPFHEQILMGYNMKKGKRTKSFAAYAVMVDKLEKAGVTLQMYLDSIDERDADGRYPGDSVTVYETWAMNKVNKSKGGAKIKNNDGYKTDVNSYRESWGKK